MTRFMSPENLVFDLGSGRLLALPAPLIRDDEVMVGYALNLEA